jgi:phospholipid/cholesterol/gamma-HCH transport system substrate-binding protein
VGVTVIGASIILAVLLLLMSGSGTFSRKITLKSYFFDAQGLRPGAPVRLSGVDIGTVKRIRIVPNRPQSPVEVTMKVKSDYAFNLHKDSRTLLSTAGVLGETYINIDSSQAHEAQAENGDVLPSGEVTGYQDVMRATQSTLQNMEALIKRMDRIVAFVERGQGSVGKLIYDAGLYNRLNATVGEFQKLMNQVSQGQGSLGKLLYSEDLYNKANQSLDKINSIIDDVYSGKGTLGKFLKDSTLYDNANSTVSNLNQMTADINAGRGALGKIARDQEFANKLQNTMNRLSDLTEKLDNGSGTAALFLRDPAVYNNSNKLLVETQELIKAIRQNPKQYLTIRLKVF